MGDQCKNCDKEFRGNFYTFFHAKKIGEHSVYISANKSRIVKEYSQIGQTTYFLCDKCVNRKFWLEIISTLIGAIALAAISILFWTGKFQNVIAAFSVPKLLFYGFIVGLVFPTIAFCLLIACFFDIRTQPTGENLAIRIGRRNIKEKDTFWNSRVFQRLQMEDQIRNL
jgi:hypothetical protein